MNIVTYQVVDLLTKAVIMTTTSRTKARNKSDKLDNVYGAVRYSVRPIFNAEV